MLFQPCIIIFFFSWNTKGDVWKNVQSACFHTIKVDGDLYRQAPQKNKNTFHLS